MDELQCFINHHIDPPPNNLFTELLNTTHTNEYYYCLLHCFPSLDVLPLLNTKSRSHPALCKAIVHALIQSNTDIAHLTQQQQYTLCSMDGYQDDLFITRILQPLTIKSAAMTICHHMPLAMTTHQFELIMPLLLNGAQEVAFGSSGLHVLMARYATATKGTEWIEKIMNKFKNTMIADKMGHYPMCLVKDIVKTHQDMMCTQCQSSIANGDTVVQQCPICRDLIKDLIKLECGHEYCKGCIGEWLETQHCCPYCRRRVAPEELEEEDARLMRQLQEEEEEEEENFADEPYLV